ncbi:MAG: Na+/H+ antiporter NhaA, partial [Bacteroidia bacterium]|nr:Na+/H+ antiporter NhaA [Bacteroidia bacterium]
EFISGLDQPHALGILAGLLIGKPLGISLAVMLLVKLKASVLPEGIGFYDIIAMGCTPASGLRCRYLLPSSHLQRSSTSSLPK